MSAQQGEMKPLRYFLGIDGRPCPRRISSMFAIAVACLLFVAQLWGPFPPTPIWGAIISLLIFGFAQEASFIAERARQAPSYGGKPGLFTDHHGHPSTLRVKLIFCIVTAMSTTLIASFSVLGNESPSLHSGLLLIFLAIPYIAKILLAYIELPGPPPSDSSRVKTGDA